MSKLDAKRYRRNSFGRATKRSQIGAAIFSTATTVFLWTAVSNVFNRLGREACVSISNVSAMIVRNAPIIFTPSVKTFGLSASI